MKTNPAMSALRHHVTGAIARGEAQAITEVPASPRPAHTPGPWSLSDSFDRVERRVKLGDNPPLVWGIASGINSAHPDYMPRAEQIANARLIASAPDLLAALEATEAKLTQAARAFYGAGNAKALREAFEGWRTTAEAARAAIAKAKGGAA